jgi:hypothetical protein
LGIAAFADAVGPGVGVANLAFYAGEPGRGASIVRGLMQGGVLAGIAWAALRMRVSAWVLGAAGIVAGLAVAPAASAHEVALALGLLAAGASTGTGSGSGTGTGTTTTTGLVSRLG